MSIRSSACLFSPTIEPFWIKFRGTEDCAVSIPKFKTHPSHPGYKFYWFFPFSAHGFNSRLRVPIFCLPNLFLLIQKCMTYTSCVAQRFIPVDFQHFAIREVNLSEVKYHAVRIIYKTRKYDSWTDFKNRFRLHTAQQFAKFSVRNIMIRAFMTSPVGTKHTWQNA